MPLRVSCPGPLLRLACLGGGGPVLVPPYLAWGCGGGGRASPGGVPSTVARGVWGHALPLPRLPAHWAGCRGPRSTCCGRGRAGVGALLCPLGRHALWGLRAAGRVCGVHVLGGGLGGGACAVPPGCAAGWGPVGRGVALPLSIPLPSLGRQESGCHWRCAVHGGRGPPYHSGSCSPGFSGYDLCGVLARRRGPACSSRPPWEPAAGAGGRVTLRLLSRAGGGASPLPRGLGARAPVACGPVGGRGGGGVAPQPPCSPSGRRPAVLNPGPLRVAGALPFGVRVRSGPRCRPGVGGGEGRPVERSPRGPCRPEPPLCPPRVGCGHGRVMWGAASILSRCARCSGTPVWARGSRSSRRSPHRVAPPAPRGRRAAPVAPQLGGLRGGGGGGAAPPPALGPEWEGGGGVGGALWSPGDAS